MGKKKEYHKPEFNKKTNMWDVRIVLINENTEIIKEFLAKDIADDWIKSQIIKEVQKRRYSSRERKKQWPIKRIYPNMKRMHH